MILCSSSTGCIAVVDKLLDLCPAHTKKPGLRPRSLTPGERRELAATAFPQDNVTKYWPTPWDDAECQNV